MGLYTPTMLGGNSYLSWFYDRGARKDPAHTGTSKRLSQAIDRGPIRKFQPKYANVYITIQSHGSSAGAQTHYVTADGVRDGLTLFVSRFVLISHLNKMCVLVIPFPLLVWHIQTIVWVLLPTYHYLDSHLTGFICDIITFT